MQELFDLLDQYTAERLKEADPCHRRFIESDVWVIMKCLNYMWMHEGEEE